MKIRITKNETSYNEYKNSFETIKHKSKEYYCTKQILKYKDNIKKTWEIIKEIIGKTKIINNNLPEKLIINENILLEKKEMENEFNNNFFIKICSKLVGNIEPSKYSLKVILTL